jgi:GrpB-like predicted nucleotidyltransferase (UPF0157 family)
MGEMKAPANRQIIIVAYRPQWTEEYKAIAGRLRDTVGDMALRVDHIGSTAVPGLAAKDVIDVQITVHELTPDLEPALLQAGYLRRGDLSVDHVPPFAMGANPRDWEKQYYQPSPGERPTHVHVRRAGSANGRYPLLFRDYLRAHPFAAEAYALVKLALAQHDPTDWDLYYDVKDPVCDVIMAVAAEWAGSVGWRAKHFS